MLENNIYCGDALHLLKELPNDCIDLIVTSPPYDNLRSYNGYCFDFENIAKELYRVTKQGGVVVWVVSDATIKGSESGTSFKQALFFKECGFNLHDTMIWKKSSCAYPDKTRYYQIFEYMFILSKGKPKTINLITDKINKYAGYYVHGTSRQPNGELKKPTGLKKGNHVKVVGCRFNVWEIPEEKNNKTGHPAVFPLQLAKDQIKSWSNPHDVVLDPFVGSGTTPLACVELNRNYIGFDISEEYCNIAKERLKNVQISFV